MKPLGYGALKILLLNEIANFIYLILLYEILGYFYLFSYAAIILL